MWDKPTILNWVANLLFALSIVAMLYMALYAVVHSSLFPLREVKVEGALQHVNREQVKLIVEKHLRGNFFTLDLVETRNVFEKLPWARTVSVRRRWPDRLDVVIEEHQALARWDTTALVNTHGEFFYAASDAELPTFSGPDDGVIEVATQYVAFSKTLQPLNMQVSRLVLTPRRAWEVVTDTGMTITLGRVDMQSRLAKFVEVYRTTLAGLNRKIMYADLRYPNGFAVRKPQIAATAVTGVVAKKSVLTVELNNRRMKKS